LILVTWVCHTYAGRIPEAAAYFREAVRLAGQARDAALLGRALDSLSNVVTAADLMADAEAARAGAAKLRRADPFSK
jgi:uncharacterized protein HemY